MAAKTGGLSLKCLSSMATVSGADCQWCFCRRYWKNCVPLMSYEGERAHAERLAEKKLRAGGETGIAAYMAEKNTESIDGLPGIEK